VTEENIPKTPPETQKNEPVKEAAKTAGRSLLWLVVALSAIAVILGVFFLGPFGLAILVPAVIAVWVAASVSAAGPAVGA
jgi:hypothetical protein